MSDEQNIEKTEEELMAEWAAMAESAEGGDSSRLLEQTEIDDFFGGTQDKKPASGLEALVNANMITYRRLPMLEVVFDKLSRFLTTTLRNFTNVNVEVTLKEMSSIRFGEYVDSIPLPALINIFEIPEWEASGIMTVDSQLFYSLVNILLGGRKSGKSLGGRIEGKPYTAIERRLVQRFVQVVLTDFGQSFEGITPVSFRFERQETIPRLAAIVPDNNASLIARVNIDMDGNYGGVFEFVLPYSALEPARDQLLQMFMGEKLGHDSIWETHLSQELWDANIEIEALLAEMKLKLGEVLSWKPGAFLNLHLPKHTNVYLKAGGTRLFRGHLTQARRWVGVQIDHTFIQRVEE
jgi:flagellar motor switch protein FliM